MARRWIERCQNAWLAALVICAALAVAVVLPGCRYAVPGDIRNCQAAVTDDTSITLTEVQRVLAGDGITDTARPNEDGTIPAAPDFSKLDREALERVALTYRRAYACLARTEAGNWIVRIWTEGGDPRQQPKATP